MPVDSSELSSSGLFSTSDVLSSFSVLSTLSSTGFSVGSTAGEGVRGEAVLDEFEHEIQKKVSSGEKVILFKDCSLFIHVLFPFVDWFIYR